MINCVRNRSLVCGTVRASLQPAPPLPPTPQRASRDYQADPNLYLSIKNVRRIKLTLTDPQGNPAKINVTDIVTNR